MSRQPRDFWSLVEKSETCWNWQGVRSPLGYGEVGSRKGNRPTPSQTKLAHRISYELLVGPIPEGLHLDHLCRNPSCVNPKHLEPVTVKENVRRGLNGVLRTECSQGHSLVGANLYVRASDNSRHCRTCRRDQQKRRRDEDPEYAERQREGVRRRRATVRAELRTVGYENGTTT